MDNLLYDFFAPAYTHESDSDYVSPLMATEMLPASLPDFFSCTQLDDVAVINVSADTPNHVGLVVCPSAITGPWMTPMYAEYSTHITYMRVVSDYTLIAWYVLAACNDVDALREYAEDVKCRVTISVSDGRAFVSRQVCLTAIAIDNAVAECKRLGCGARLSPFG